MRYLVGFLGVLAVLTASPGVAHAQTGEEGSSRVERWHPEAYVDPSGARPGTTEPSLELDLDEAGVHVVPQPLRTEDGYTLEEIELRVSKARLGVGLSSLAFAGGVAALMGAAAGSFCISFGEPCATPTWVGPVIAVGVVLSVGGLAGMIASAVALRKRKTERNHLREATRGSRSRARWDLAGSRLVF